MTTTCKFANTKIIRDRITGRWHLLDQWGWSLCSSDKPSVIRRKKLGHFLFMTRPDSECDSIIERYFKDEM